MAQQTDGYLKLYTYKSTDTNTQFRDFREQIAGYQIDNIESNFEKIDTVYTSNANNQVIDLVVAESTEGNIFSATLSGKYLIQNNTKLTIKFPSILPEEIANRNNFSITYTDIITNAEKTIIGNLNFYDRNGSLYEVTLADIQPNNIYSIIYNVISSKNYFILESLKNSVIGMAGITADNILAKDTDYSFKDSGIAYTDVLTKPSLNDITTGNVLQKLVDASGNSYISDSGFSASDVFLRNGTTSYLGENISFANDTSLIANSNKFGDILSTGCLDNIVLNKNNSVSVKNPISINLSVNSDYANDVALMPESKAVLTPYGIFVFLRAQNTGGISISGNGIIQITSSDSSFTIPTGDGVLTGFVTNSSAFGSVRACYFDVVSDQGIRYLKIRGTLANAYNIFGFGVIPI
nr:MAG TPA: hypothetical protein [Caudoviricetes sp.]